MNPQLQGGATTIQGSSPSIQGSSPILQASNNQTKTLQPAAGINIVQPQASQVSANQTAINNSVAQNNNTSNQISALLKSIQAEEQANAPGVALSQSALNLNALQGQAQQSAQNTVNPLYTQYLNQYLQQESANTQAAQAQNSLNLQGEQSALGNTLQQNQLQQTQAGNKNALEQANINVQQQNYQLASGNAQTAKMQAIGQQIGSGNLGASGLGQQQLYQAENARNIADAAQAGQFQYQRDSSNLSTQDTFDQLAQSSAYATTAEGQQEAQTNFNLNDYLRQAAYNDAQYREANEGARQQALTATSQQSLASMLQNAINGSGVSGKDYAATEQAYNNYLSPSLSLPSAPNQNDYINAAGAAV